MDLTWEQKVEFIKTYYKKDKPFTTHSAYIQSEMHLNDHREGKPCDIRWCVIEFEYQKLINKTK